MKTRNFDIIINGAGMIGSSCAIGLAQLGFKVGVIQAKNSKQFCNNEPINMQSCAINLRSELLLQKIGAWSWIQQQRLNPYTKMAVFQTQTNQLIFDAAEHGLPYLGHFIENKIIESSNTIRFGQCQNIEQINQAITGISQEKQKVTVTFANQEQITANLLIGADGNNSIVRELAGIAITGKEYPESALAIKIKSEHIDSKITKQQFSGKSIQAILPLANQEAVLIWYNPIAKNQYLKKSDTTELHQAALAAFQAIIPDFTILDVGSFSLKKIHAKKYIDGKVLLIGDAAHCIHPFAGQGVNMGFKGVDVLLSIMQQAITQNRDPFASRNLRKYELIRKADNLFFMRALDTLLVTFQQQNLHRRKINEYIISGAQNIKFLKNAALNYAVGIK